jgi:hypothetical protein
LRSNFEYHICVIASPDSAIAETAMPAEPQLEMVLILSKSSNQQDKIVSTQKFAFNPHFDIRHGSVENQQR